MASRYGNYVTIRGPKRIQGWLRVWDTNVVEHECLFENGSRPEPKWQPQYCVLKIDEQTISQYHSQSEATPINSRCMTKIICAKDDFERHYGMELTENRAQPYDPLSMRRIRDSSYDRAVEDERRGSIPSLNVNKTTFSVNHVDESDKSSLASSIDHKVGKKSGGIKSQFIRRARSITKPEKKRNIASPTTAKSHNDTASGWTYVAPASPNQTLPAAGSTNPAIVLDRSLSQNSNSTSDGFLGRLKRSMSLSRLNKKRSRSRLCAEDEQTSQPANYRFSKVKAARSYESLLASANKVQTVDLGEGDNQVVPLDRSLLGEDNCLKITSSKGCTFYNCRNSEERSVWLNHLKKTVNPGEDQMRRSDVSLKIWVQEAKCCPSKKNYFCEISLDNNLYARTSCKQKGDMLFWGEQFDFDNLPDIRTITVMLYKEAEKKKKRDKQAVMGHVTIPISELQNRQISEKWYSVVSPSVGKFKDNKAEVPLIRIKIRYQTVQILPLQCYSHLIKFLKSNYQSLVDRLEPLLSVRSMEDISSSLIHILQREQMARRFLCDTVISEISKQENSNLILRGNTIATKAIEAYMKLVGNRYLHDTLEDFIRLVIESDDSCEVDPGKLPSSQSLQKNQATLISYCEMVWGRIINSHSYFPSELRDVFTSFRRQCEHLKKTEVADNLISACIFLRFLCPAILSPSLFGLCQELPEERQSRNFTLVAKTLQSLANFTKFGTKEGYMIFMNEFVEREWNQMKNFLKQISASDHTYPLTQFDGYIDCGKHLSLLHSQLLENLPKPESEERERFSDLEPILTDLTDEINQNKNSTLMRKKAKELNSSQGNSGKVMWNSRPESDEYVELSQDKCKGLQTDPLISVNRPAPGKQHNVMSAKDVHHAIRLPNDSSASSQTAHVEYSDGKQIVTLTQSLPNDTDVANRSDTDTMKTNSSTGSRKIVRHRVWDRVLTASDLVNGDYIDLISYMEDKTAESAKAAASDAQMNTSTSSSGYYTCRTSDNEEATSHTLKKNKSTVTANNSTASNVTSKEPPLAFVNPAFRHGGMIQPIPRRSSEATSPAMEFSPLPNKFHSLNLRGTSKKLEKQSVVLSPTVENKGNLHGMADRTYSNSSSVSGFSISDGRKDEEGSSNHIRDEKRFGCAKFPTSELYPENSVRSQPDGSNSVDVLSLHQSSNQFEGERPSTPCSWAGSQLSLNSQQTGIRSVQKQIDETEKIKQQYEAEVAILKTQLAEAQSKLSGTEGRLAVQADQTNQVIDEWKLRLDESEERLRAQQVAKDEQIKGIIQRLLAIEEDLRQEQQEMKSAIARKEQIIDSQERRIRELDTANAKLQRTLNDLKDKVQKAQKTDKTYKTTLYVNDFKSSFC